MPEQLDAVSDAERLAALAELNLLDSPREAPFDRLAELAAAILSTPVALVSLVDRDRQFFVSCPGLPEPWQTRRETPLSHSFCQHAVRTGEPIVISDARREPEFADNRAIEDLNVIAYAGIPLTTSTGYVLGSFCVIDHEPREWDTREIEILRSLAASVVTEIELRGALLREQAARRNAETATAAAEQATEQLQVVDRRKTQFLATLAHELRNPLSAISSGVALVDMAEGAELREVQTLMKSQVDQMTRLVDDLMDVARITEGKIQLSKKRVDVWQVVEDSAATARPMVEEANHQLAVDCPQSMLHVDADHQRLVQVFGNLLANACRYTPRGGQIEIRARAGDEGVEVVVADNGIGIPAAKLPKIFDMFAQVDGGGGRRGGLGIGLTLVQRIVELHGGRVVAVSDGENQGSQFCVYLPSAE